MSSQVTLKERVEKALKKSLFCINNEEIFLHPAVIGDCVKSLIGSNLNDPYLKLVDWLENEIEKLDFVLEKIIVIEYIYGYELYDFRYIRINNNNYYLYI